ncbi:MAG: filamentous hemagglutinin family protein [Azoarcus sp.]|nr:filamentous hemagglutinin family protein [Azoarcus sp.]
MAGLQGVDVAMDRNFVEVDLRINELRDSPLLADSWLRGQTVVVDRRESGVFASGPMSGVLWGGKAGAWQGTPLADVSAWIGVGVTDLQEVSTAGGSLLLKSSGDLITRPGSLLDISGGSVNYTGGWNTTTLLLGADGLIYTMGNARPDIAYTGIAGQYIDSHDRWGVSETYTSPLMGGLRYENGYSEGRDAGSLQMYVNQGVALEGDIAGGVVTGERQASGAVKAAQSGTWTFGGNDNSDRSWLLGEVIVSDAPARLSEAFDASTALDAAFTRGSYNDKTTWIDVAVLRDSGLGDITLHLGGDFTLDTQAGLELAPLTRLLIESNVGTGEGIDITLNGRLSSAGGDIALLAGEGGTLTLGEGAAIDVSGQWINALSGEGGAVAAIDGGSVRLGANEVTVAEAASIAVNGGGAAWLEDGGPTLTMGDAGSVSLSGRGFDNAALSRLEFSGWAAGSGGSLSLMVEGDAQIGGAAGAGVFALPETLYAERGFRAVSVTTANGNIEIADGAQVTLLPLSWDMDTMDWRRLASGARLEDVLTARAPRDEERLARAPARLVLSAGNADLRLGEGARVTVDTGGAVALTTTLPGAAAAGVGQITLLGEIEAPAGSIAIDAADDLLLADGALLSAAGAPVIYRGGNGFLTGQVFDGGSVSLASGGTMTLEAGSLIDVSGASGSVEYTASENGLPVTRGQALASDGGSISITTGAGVLDATLVADAGGEGAAGGVFSVREDSQGGASGQLISTPLSSYLWYVDTDQASTGTTSTRRQGADGRWYQRLSASSANLNLFGDYADAGTISLSNTGISYSTLNNLPASVATSNGLLLVNGAAADAVDGSVTYVSAWDYDPAIDERVVYLLNEYFYQGTGMVPGAKITIGEIATSASGGAVVSAPLIAAGGFSDVTLTSANMGLTLADDIDLALPNAALHLYTPVIRNDGDGSARLAAACLSLGRASGVGTGTAPETAGGTLTLAAEVIDLATNGADFRIRGFDDTRLAAGELRFTRDEYTASAVLDVTGGLTITSGRVYPATATQATIRSDTSITVLDNGQRLGTPLSAGGTLTLTAPVIEQSGTLYAPFGGVILNAAESLTLGAGGLTSVSGDGVIAPYGFLGNNEYWNAPYTPYIVWDPAGSSGIAQLPDKRVTLDAPEVDIAEGAVIDIRGGGDLYANEFVPGTGGSHDILKLPGAYAVLPSETSGVAPAGSAGTTGQRIWLAGGNGLSAGWYTLMPASYAALPGAYLVLPTGGKSTFGALPGSVALSDGSVMMAGRLGNALTGAEEAASGYWQVLDGAQMRQYSEYNEALASAFFASDAFKLTRYHLSGVDIVTPRLSTDAGSVVFRTLDLTLDGTLLAQAAEGGRGGEADIAAERIAIVGAGQDAGGLDDYLIIDATALSGFGVESLLLGGTRSQAAEGTGVTVIGKNIELRNDADTALTGPEIILAATNEVRIADGSVLRAIGAADGNANDLIIGAGSGALVRVSTAGPVAVQRSATSAANGVVTIGEDAILEGGAALLIDATKTTELAANALVSGQAVSVAAGRIGLGGGTEGLVLGEAALAQLADAEALTLKSYSSIDVYDTVDFLESGLSSVTLDAARVNGHTGGNLRLEADFLTLMNSGATAASAGASGSGSLALAANELTLGEGAVIIDGFGRVTLDGRARIVAVADGQLDAGEAALTLTTPVLSGENAANYAWITEGALRLAGAEGEATGDLPDGLGASLALKGGTVRVDGRIVARGGAIDLAASSGDLILAEGARLDVSGLAKAFFDVFAYANAGRVGLTATMGDIALEGGAHLNLDADAGGGNGGALSIQTDGGEVRLNGTFSARAGNGGEGGSFSLDLPELGNFAALNATLNATGFDAARDFRVRGGDVSIDGLTRVADFRLGADNGTVTVTGEIDAQSRYGGNIAISASDGVTLENGARLAARATDTELGSGRVLLDAGEGRLHLKSGSVIDVSGGENGGVVRLRARQTEDHDGVAVTALAGEILGARSAVLEAVAVYEADTLGAVRDMAVADAATFAGNASAIQSALNNDTVAVMSGIEIQSAGDLTVDEDWNLRDLFTQREGGLTLRAAGDLLVTGGNLSDGFSTAATDGVLQADESWTLRLVAGADLSAADVMAARPLLSLAEGKGNVVVGDAAAGRLARTGTGDLYVAAGRGLLLPHANSAIYTAGKADTTEWEDFTTVPSLLDYYQTGYSKHPETGTYGYWVTVTPTPLLTAAYGIQGGNLSIDTQASVSGAMTSTSDAVVFDWLRRMGRSVEYGSQGTVTTSAPTTPFIDGNQSTWYVDYAKFDLGVGALGGGNVSINSGGDIANLLVAQPTHGRVRGGRTADEAKVLELANGGAMTVVAEGAIRGGQYYVGRGEGAIAAAALAQGSAAAPVLALGDSAFSVTTAGELRLQTVIDPLTRAILFDTRSSSGGTNTLAAGSMPSYSEDTALSLFSVGGDVITLANGRYPATTGIVAFGGAIQSGGLSLLPGHETDLRVLAAKNLTGSFSTSRANPEGQASPYNPQMVASSSWVDPTVDWTVGDDEPSRLYALTGNASVSVTMGEALWLRAGNDIRGGRLFLRNNHATDVSLVEAGHDVTGGNNNNYAGAWDRLYEYIVQGPGNLVVSAGRDVYNVDVLSVGNYDSWDGDTSPGALIPHLPPEGASITVMAGINGAVGYEAFASAYLDPANVAAMPDYLTTTLADGTRIPLYLVDVRETRGEEGELKTTQRGLVSFIAEVTGQTLDPLAAWERFQALPELTQQVFLRRVFQQELREAGRNQNTLDARDNPINGGYNRGYAAIGTLFPGDAWKGDVTAFDMMLRTMLGGDIDIFAPGGALQVAALSTTPPAGRGIITLAGGHIGVFTNDDITVNGSRVLAFVPEATARGSDMILWSSNGDVDAGRGAKTVRVPSGPIVETDVNAFTTVTERADMSGSGIGTIGDGDVDLVAPKGVINAGDAGIRAAGNLNLAALLVLNADNIQVEGESTGLPVLASVNIGALTNATAAANSAVQAAQDVVKRQARETRPSIIDVKVLGFGGKPVVSRMLPDCGISASANAEISPECASPIASRESR